MKPRRAGTERTFHLHRDSDEVAYVLSGEITFRIGDELTVGGPGTCAFLPRGVSHAWKNTGTEIGREFVSIHPGRGWWAVGGRYASRVG
jgi:quercetin dioxygenase-like cupin family protein